MKEITEIVFLIALNIGFISGIFLMIFYIYEIIKEEKDLFYNLQKQNDDLLDQIILRDAEIHHLKEHIKNS